MNLKNIQNENGINLTGVKYFTEICKMISGKTRPDEERNVILG